VLYRLLSILFCLTMRLSHITIQGFKSFAKKTTIDVTQQVTGVVGPNGSGKSNIAESIRFVLGEQSMKSMRGKIGADVIFKGSEHLAPMSRASVTMVIDNKKKDGTRDIQSTSPVSDTLAPYLVYDELTLSRIMYADGTSDYTLNDAKVRLKDVQELLSFAGIGGSAHTIINQGEADRILLASPRDRKEVLEDALGLRVYHMRLNESARKLEKVKTHVREVELLRTEIKPHLQHLERQVKKIEAQAEERKNLHALLVAYFHKEDGDLQVLRERIFEQGTSESLLTVTHSIEKELALVREHKKDVASDPVAGVTAEKERLYAEEQVLMKRKDQVIKTLGRLEGEKVFLEKELARDREVTSSTIPTEELKTGYTSITNGITSLTHALSLSDTERAQLSLSEIKNASNTFFHKYIQGDTVRTDDIKKEVDVLVVAIAEHEATLLTLSDESSVLTRRLIALDTEVEVKRTSRHEEEKKVMLLESKLRELQSIISLRRQEESELALRAEYYQALLQEGVVIVGRILLDYKTTDADIKYRDTKKQDLMRAIERSKLRIEEAGVPNKEEVIAEYRSTKERDEYLMKELVDITESEQKLCILIDELTMTLSEKFASGVEEVSKVFDQFFGEVFVGGKAKVVVIKSTKIDAEGNETEEQGIDLDVTLPNKKVKEISMFSGGERALVSIALLFAMSSITPPPFMVLDETDAPLDESNARKYGAMLKRLSEHSKLLVITHNRETMNHCDMLYGVTIGVDGGSKLLSITFKQAEEVVQ
jgi:chromosome segregation protein